MFLLQKEQGGEGDEGDVCNSCTYSKVIITQIMSMFCDHIEVPCLELVICIGTKCDFGLFERNSSFWFSLLNYHSLSLIVLTFLNCLVHPLVELLAHFIRFAFDVKRKPP